MKTVKEISDLTGISVRTLHYYDEIGLFTPTKKNENGYRLYDDRALETLQQILFFREFDIPLKEIKSVLENPALDRNQILQMQKKMLTAKKERIECLITSIDEILRGGNQMDHEVFNRSELEELCQFSADHMPERMRQIIVQEFGSVDQWKQHYIERASKEDIQKSFLKMVEWYGDKESAFQAAIHPPAQEVVDACQNRIDAVCKKLAEKKEEPLDSFSVKETVAEYGFVVKQLYQIKHEDALMRSIASTYREEKIRAATDERYGEGSSEFFARAIEGFYKNE